MLNVYASYTSYEFELRAADTMGHYRLRDRFGFAVPTRKALNIVAKYGPILEVGAGSGYWAYELRNRFGVDIIATDIAPGPKNHYKALNIAPCYVDVQELSALEAIAKYPGRSLLICWPCYDQAWAAEAIKAYKGEYLLYGGESQGGCTADDSFFWFLEDNFEEVEDAPLGGGAIRANDYLVVYKRRSDLCHTKNSP